MRSNLNRSGAWRAVAALLTLGLVAGTNVASSGEVAGCGEAPPPLTFAPKVYIDADRSGGEPVAITAEDGSILVSAHAGTTHYQPDGGHVPGSADFAVGYFNQTLNWRSVDFGESWEYVGIAGTGQGPHSLTSTGFSDPDFAMDQAGTIYNVEIDLVNTAVFSSRDDGQSFLLAHPEVWPGDRPWLVANEADEVFLYVNLPKQFLRSRDGGVTWLPLGSPPFDDKPVTDPANPDDGIIGPIAGGTGISISADDGESWTTHNLSASGVATPRTTGPFVNVAADSAGNAYIPYASGYTGPNDKTADGRVHVSAFDRDTERWTVTEIDVEEQLGYAHDAQWPWAIAGDDGRVAITWLGTGPDLATGEYNDDHMYLYAAYSMNANGTDCDGDGVNEGPARWSVARATEEPIHIGQLCTGTGCNALGNGDRRLGDFHSIQMDHTGRMFIVSGDTRLPGTLGGPKPVSNPIFVAATGDVPTLLETPVELRETRCLEPLGLTPLCED